MDQIRPEANKSMAENKKKKRQILRIAQDC